MKAAVALTVALLSAAAQAAVTETVNSLTYSIQYFDADGSELPVELGPAASPRGRRSETDPAASPRGRRSETDPDASPRGRRAEPDPDASPRGRRDETDPDASPRGRRDETDPDASPRGRRDEFDPYASPRGRRSETDPDASPRGRRDETDPAASPRGRRDEIDPDASPRGRRDETDPAASPRGRRDEFDPHASPRGRRSETDPDASPRGRRAALQQRSQTLDSWCGAANLQPPGGGTWSGVSGKWTVPAIARRPGQAPSDQPSSLLQGVGIGGDGCLPDGSTRGGGGSDRCQSGGGIVGGGTVSQIGRDGKQENFVYVEFWPETLRGLRIPVSAGDEMLGRVTSDSPTTGNITVVNTSTGAWVRAAYWGSRPALAGSSVQWTVSAIGSASSGRREPFADFTDTSFTECQATTDGGQSAGPGTNDINLMQNDRLLCTGRIEGSNVHLHSSN